MAEDGTGSNEDVRISKSCWTTPASSSIEYPLEMGKCDLFSWPQGWHQDLYIRKPKRLFQGLFTGEW